MPVQVEVCSFNIFGAIGTYIQKIYLALEK